MRTVVLSFVCVCLSVMLSAAASAEPIVFDFESGSLAGENWKIVSGANSKPVGSRDAEFHSSTPYDKHGKYYLTTLESSANANPTDDTICVLESPVFQVAGDKITLKAGGGKREKTYIGLCPVNADGSVGEPVRKAQGLDSQKLIEIVWDTAELRGKAFVLQVVDNEIGGWGHIRMDDFRAEGSIDTAKTTLRGKFLIEVIAKQEAEEKAKSETVRKNPVLNAYPILYVTRQQYRGDHHNTATIFQKGEINTGSFRGGASMRIWNPKDNSVKVLLEVPNGIVRDPCLSFDAKKVLVSIRRDINDDYHIYEFVLNENAAGTGPFVITPETKLDASSPLKQLTQLSGVSDIDPIYLPTGEIAFSSTREPKYCMCNRHIMANLYKMNGDGSNILQIGKSTLFEGHASLTHDGRILYDRWEYVDRNFGDAQGLWITTTDGFNHAIWWGNNTASPGGVIDARVLPGKDSEFLAVFGSCHDRPWGAIALVDRQKGIDGRKAVLQTWPADAINLVSEEPTGSFVESRRYDTFSRVRPKLEDPFPLSDDWFIASGMTGQGERTGIYLLGRDGTMQLVFDDKEVQGCFDPMPLTATTPPPANVQTADLTQPTGTFYVTNVYEGMGMASVPKGSAKFLRVVESPEKRTWSSKGWGNGHGEQGPGMNWYEFINKRILGTVPIEDDGSVNFKVPADKFVYFQLLDSQGQMIQSMRSGIIIRPGETNGCVGCHEDRLAVVPPPQRTPAALTKPPRTLQPWYGETRDFSYVKEVQEPVFDKYCTACHDYGKVEANPQKPNLAGDLNTIFNTSYVSLYKKNLIKPVGAGPHIKLPPYAWGATQSKLAAVMLKGHPQNKTGAEIDAKRKELGLYIDRQTNPEAVDRVLTWIDLNAPYYPTYLTSFPNNRFGRSPLTDEQMNRLAELCGYKSRYRSGGSDGQTDLDWAVSFTRPELSPCLAKLKETDAASAAYEEALGILAAGKKNLNDNPRGDVDHQGVPAPERDAKQETKYNFLREVEEQVRRAVINQTKVYDKDFRN